MVDRIDPRTIAGAATAPVKTADIAYDAGQRSYMLSVYNYMASGVLLTGIVALLFARSGAAAQVLGGPGILKYLIMLAPLAFVMVLSFGITKLSTWTAQLLFWAFAVVMGLSLASIFLVYTGTSIATTFVATAAAFAGLSLWGYTTKRDLSALGTFLIMGVVGLLVALVINMFMRSTGLQLIISFAGVLLFAGLTAYDTQRIKSMYADVAGSDMMAKSVIMGALSLYLDFVNMFMFLLRLTGNQR
jgi:FtsH-binding integral membrane protein